MIADDHGPRDEGLHDPGRIGALGFRGEGEITPARRQRKHRPASMQLAIATASLDTRAASRHRPFNEAIAVQERPDMKLYCNPLAPTSQPPLLFISETGAEVDIHGGIQSGSLVAV